MFIKVFDENGETIGVERIDQISWIRVQPENNMVVLCDKKFAQGIVSKNQQHFYFQKGYILRGIPEKSYIEISEAEYEEYGQYAEDPEDENPDVPYGQDPDKLPTRAELAERIAALEEQNEFLSECLIEMSEVVYA